jgi:cobalt/nickel transport system permease protein
VTVALRDSSPPDSPLARWDARWKLAAIVLFLVSVAILKTPAALAAALFASLVAVGLARVTLLQLAGRLGLLSLAVLPFFILPMFQQGGWSVVGRITARCFAIGLLVASLIHSTPLPQLVAAARALGLPSAIVLVAQLAIRYFAILAGEVRRARIAMQVRGFRLRTNTHTYRTLGHLTGTVLVRSGERGERIADAMQCRGFTGRATQLPSPRGTRWDVLAFVMTLFLAGALLAWDRYGEGYSTIISVSPTQPLP